MLKPSTLLLLAVLSPALAAATTEAAAGPYPYLVVRRGDDVGISLDQAVQQVRRETGGRVLSADRITQGGRAAYRIKVLTPSGHVRVVVIDAQSGVRR
jgi:uncharacterized membrane protein YkoI